MALAFQFQLAEFFSPNISLLANNRGISLLLLQDGCSDELQKVDTYFSSFVTRVYRRGQQIRLIRLPLPRYQFTKTFFRYSCFMTPLTPFSIAFSHGVSIFYLL
jgi:hypothetical protein